MSNPTIEQLRSRVGGAVITPGDAGYDRGSVAPGVDEARLGSAGTMPTTSSAR